MEPGWEWVKSKPPLCCAETLSTIPQLEYRIKQAGQKLERRTKLVAEIETDLRAAKKGSPTAGRLQKKLEKARAEVQENLGLIEELRKEIGRKEKTKAPPPKPKIAKKKDAPSRLSRPTRATPKSQPPKDFNEAKKRIAQLEDRVVELEKARRKLELANTAALERHKETQNQLKVIEKLANRVLILESQKEIPRLAPEKPNKSVSIEGSNNDRRRRRGDSRNLEQLFQENPLEKKPIFQPQGGRLRPTLEPMAMQEPPKIGGTTLPTPLDATGRALWPPAVTTVIEQWLRGRRSWDHSEWQGLLDKIIRSGHEPYANPSYHARIGQFIETHRPR